MSGLSLTVDALTDEVQRLQSQLGRNSGNSSMPVVPLKLAYSL
jgi:hypothetical protein